MNMALKFLGRRNAKPAANKLNRLSGYHLNDMGIKRFVTADNTIRFI